MYKATDKICDLMSHEEDAIHVISRFGLQMGVGDQTIAQACDAHHVHTDTFLAVINYKIYKQQAATTNIDLPTLQQYLRNAHTYFLDFRLPHLRHALIEALIPADPRTKIPMLILNCYDEFVEEIRAHIEHEDAGMYEEHARDDQRITDKLTEIKNLIIKYYPTQNTEQNGTVTYTLIQVMSDLWHTEQDFADHCAIEDDILRPAINQSTPEEPLPTTESDTESLSEREHDVLIQIVKGLSNKEIADILCISVHTVITHRKNITRKLNIHSTAGLTIYAIVNKLIDLNNME
ncbi:MAG: helix-turn-helix transcriptional regulator [Paludibacteraceae bacterium]|nr:helix-turn-helix transcriptional regulator [Paludibacteraceae bacterium]